MADLSEGQKFINLIKNIIIIIARITSNPVLLRVGFPSKTYIRERNNLAMGYTNQDRNGPYTVAGSKKA